MESRGMPPAQEESSERMKIDDRSERKKRCFITILNEEMSTISLYTWAATFLSGRVSGTMAFALSLDNPRRLERECRERPNFANFPDSIRIIRRLAEFALRDF